MRDFNQKIIIPNSVISLAFGYGFIQKIYIPNSVKYLDLWIDHYYEIFKHNIINSYYGNLNLKEFDGMHYADKFWLHNDDYKDEDDDDNNDDFL